MPRSDAIPSALAALALVAAGEGGARAATRVPPPAPFHAAAQPRRTAPQPVDAVRTCSLGGGAFTGVQVPGTGTCVKAGGFVRWQAGGSR